MTTKESNPTCGILYVDDEEKALKYFRMAFAEKFQVFTASSGAEALEIVRRESKSIGIVISDQRMPGMLGAEILGVVREEFPNIVRILTTAYSDLDSAIQAVNQGHIYQYVVKPWEIPDLRMILQRAADYHRVLAERNELLALKLATLQRILCSDRVKWLLLATRYWDAPAQDAFRRALGALVQALPDSPAQFLAVTGKFSTRRFEIAGLIRHEYQNASRCFDAIDQSRAAHVAPAASLQTLAAKIRDLHHLGPEHVVSTPTSLRITPGSESFATADFARAVFGLLFDQDIPDLSISVFETLVAFGASAGSLDLSVDSPSSLALRFAFPPAAPTSGEIIDALAAKFSAWDIAGL